MNPSAPYSGAGKKFGELSLWTGASVLVLTAHIAAAALLLQEEPPVPDEGAPPAAIMIELAPEPEAVNTQEDQIAPDMEESQEVKSEETQPVEEAQPDPAPEPTPVEPPPEVADLPEPPPPEPVIEEPAPEPPPPEVAEPLPEPPPEPIEEPDPIEQQITAALENVEVPLPTMRPPPPKPEVAEKKPEPKKETPKRAERRRQQAAQQERAQAKAQVTQSNRNAASQSSSGSAFSANVSPARWMTRVRAKIARNARRCPGNGTGIVTVRFSFDSGGNISNVSVARSSGDSAIDNYVTSAVRRASPIPAPPSGVASSLSQPVKCE